MVTMGKKGALKALVKLLSATDKTSKEEFNYLHTVLEKLREKYPNAVAVNDEPSHYFTSSNSTLDFSLSQLPEWGIPLWPS